MLFYYKYMITRNNLFLSLIFSTFVIKLTKMIKLPITKEELLIQYNQEIDNICEICDWKTNFTGQEVCSIVHGIIIRTGIKTKLTESKLHVIYNKHITSLNLSDVEWRKNYKIPQIIEIIYNILNKNI